jgi:hypothetical protein
MLSYFLSLKYFEGVVIDVYDMTVRLCEIYLNMLFHGKKKIHEEDDFQSFKQQG